MLVPSCTGALYHTTVRLHYKRHTTGGVYEGMCQNEPHPVDITLAVVPVTGRRAAQAAQRGRVLLQGIVNEHKLGS